MPCSTRWVATFRDHLPEHRVNKAEYQQYLRSPWWQAVRVWAFRRAKGRCQGEGCGARRGLEVHHLCYDHLGDERTCDVKLLCSACHQRAHQLPVEPRERPVMAPAMPHISEILWPVMVEIERKAFANCEVA